MPLGGPDTKPVVVKKPPAQSSTSGAPSSTTTNSTAAIAKEFIVRAPNKPGRRFSLLRFHSSNAIDFTKSKEVFMNRENNFRQFKTAHDIVDQPTFGAGSEYGRELKEEARRKKYGITRKGYKPGDQPWIMTAGKGKDAKRFKGTQEGGISDNATYFVFFQCKDGAFEAHPVSEWYNMTPSINYRFLREDEAEEEYTKRHKQLNMFNIMVRKRVNVDGGGDDGEPDGRGDVKGGAGRMDADADDEMDEGAEKGTKKTKKGRKSLQLTEMEDWLNSSDEDDGDVSDDPDDKKKKGKKGAVKKRKKKKDDSDSEVQDDSELDDHDGDEVDYMTHSSSDEEKLPVEEREKMYAETGVEDEAGLKRLLTDRSDDEEEEAKDGVKPEDKEKEEEKETTTGRPVKAEGRSSSSGSNSSSSSEEDSDSEIDKKASVKVDYWRRLSADVGKSVPDTVSLTPNRKRPSPSDDPADASTAGPPASKRATPGSITAPLPPLPATSSIESDLESMVRKYLIRKPISAPELLKKIRTKKLVPKGKDAATLLAAVLNKIKPLKHDVNGHMKLSLKS